MGMDPSRRGRQADHYNTGEIILRLEKDRRRALVMFFSGLCGVLVLIAILSVFSRSKAPPAEPTSINSMMPAPPPAIPAPKPAAPAAPLAPPVAGVHVKINLPKAAPTWVDGESQGVKKVFDLTMKPGKHEVKVRFGRKIITDVVAVTPDAPVNVFLDPHKKRAVVRAIP